MGQISISIGGSFKKGNGVQGFSAMKSGHAAALSEAIDYLASLLPSAIQQDHQLQAEGAFPEDRFGIPE